jgi:hypothetical protein
LKDACIGVVLCLASLPELLNREVVDLQVLPSGKFMACGNDSWVLAITDQEAITGFKGKSPKGQNATAGYVFGESEAVGCHTT